MLHLTKPFSTSLLPFGIRMWLLNWRMQSTDGPYCDICYDLKDGLARMADQSCNEPYGNDQSIRTFDDGSVLIYVTRDLVRAQSTKCIFCALIRRVDSSPGPGTHLLRVYPDRTPAIDMDSARRRRRFEIYQPTDLPPELEANSIALEVSGLFPFQHVPKRPAISSQPLSERAFAFIRECLETCVQKHGVCRQGTSDPPKRLMDIENPGNTCVKVVETSSTFHEPYVALSYCWGRGVYLKTTKANISDMMMSIERAALPPVISDAIRITGVLGFRYIWVDSLCIVQDDVRDWEEESARMCSIYEGAYLTIAASSAESADVPLNERYRRHEPTVFRCRQGSDSTDRGTTSTVLHLAAREECEYGFHNEDAVRRPDREPLHDRGWTLQEAILSTRVVFYTPTELQWQCQAVQTCQCRIPPPTKPGVMGTRAHMRGGPGASRRPHEIFAAWDLIVEAYTERLLTNPDDKLPALSGLAQLVRRNISAALGRHEGAGSRDETLPSRQPEYVAGLWRDDLVRGMLWDPLHGTVNLPHDPSRTTTTTIILGAHVRDDVLSETEKSHHHNNHNNNHHHHHHYYRAPSFSWTSVDGPVTYISRNRNLPRDDASYVETARVVDAWSRPAGVDPLGRLAATDKDSSIPHPRPRRRRSRPRTGVVLRAPLIEGCALVANTSGSMHNSPWTLREIEPRWDSMSLDTGSVVPFPVVVDDDDDDDDDGSASGTKTGTETDTKNRVSGGGPTIPKWSVRRAHGRTKTAPGAGEADGETAAMGGVALLMMAQNARAQRFLLLGVAPSDPRAYERLGTVSTSRISGGGDLVRLSGDDPSRVAAGAWLEGVAEWRGKGGVVSRMRTVTIV